MYKDCCFLIEILKCKHCGILAVSLNETRVTNHKCAGAWKVELSEWVPKQDVRAALKGEVGK